MIDEWNEKETVIAEIRTLLENGYEVEVDSPDGYVSVVDFVNKGIHNGYRLQISGFDDVIVSGGHLFETSLGWMEAEFLEDKGEINFLTSKGYKKGIVSNTGIDTSIVDIMIDHPNHRYFTNGISSHNTGKSLFLCHFSAAYLAQGKNVLYISMEMAEEEIARRIDTNLLNISFDDLEALPKDLYERKVLAAKQKTDGKLIIKEYPSTTASVIHFRALLNELSLKKGFVPDVICIDYLNICASSRLKASASSDTYTYVKSIAEEVRGFAQQQGIPVWSATQLNRPGFSSSDPDMTNVSECIHVDENVTLIDGTNKKIGDITVGDQITSNDIYKTVMNVHHKKMKSCVEITTKSGKKITVSKDHVFPSSIDGNIQRRSVNTGLTIGCKIHSKKS